MRVKLVWIILHSFAEPDTKRYFSERPPGDGKHLACHVLPSQWFQNGGKNSAVVGIHVAQLLAKYAILFLYHGRLLLD
jgi:hypothetical protein